MVHAFQVWLLQVDLGEVDVRARLLWIEATGWVNDFLVVRLESVACQEGVVFGLDLEMVVVVQVIVVVVD